MGSVYTSLGIYSAAEPLLQRATVTYRQIAGGDSSEVLSVTSALADVYFYQGRFQEAERYYHQIMTSRERHLGAQHSDTLKAAFDWASTYVPLGQFEKARPTGRY
jgi:tetratricopeptide (TPR) repeat protein